MRRDLHVCIHKIKRCIAAMSVEGPYDEKLMDRQTDKSIRLLEWLDEQLLQKDSPHDDSAALVIRHDAGWHKIADGDLPPAQKDLLFCTGRGQTYEGFLQKKDLDKPFKTEDGKYSFADYPDGGKWYRYHYHDMLDMDQVVAWMWKPTI